MDWNSAGPATSLSCNNRGRAASKETNIFKRLQFVPGGSATKTSESPFSPKICQVNFCRQSFRRNLWEGILDAQIFIQSPEFVKVSFYAKITSCTPTCEWSIFFYTGSNPLLTYFCREPAHFFMRGTCILLPVWNSRTPSCVTSILFPVWNQHTPACMELAYSCLYGTRILLPVWN